MKTPILACLALVAATLAPGCEPVPEDYYSSTGDELTIVVDAIYPEGTSDDAILFFGSVYGGSPGVTVEWHNATSDIEGTAQTNPLFGDYPQTDWAAVVPLVRGDNVIVFTARDAGYAPDSDAVVVTRDDAAPPAH